MKKSIVYVRVSSKEQAEGYSLSAQLGMLRDYAKKNSLEIVEEYVESESARKSGRKEFNRMLERLRTDKSIVVVLAEKTDRLYRNFKDYNHLDYEANDYEIHLVKEGTILSKHNKSSDKLNHGLKVLLAKNFCDNLSEETKKGMYEMLDVGKYPFMAPIGYTDAQDDSGIKKIDKHAAPFVKKAFEYFSAGQYSRNSLSAKLYEEGFRARRSKIRPNKEYINRILTNPFYYGMGFVKGRFYPLKHEPIITKALFDKVQGLLSNKIKPKFNTRNLPFSGLMTCGHCGRAITGEEKRKKSGKTYVYYHCTGNKNQCSNVVYIEQAKIMEAFQDAIKQIDVPEFVIEKIKSSLEATRKEDQVYHDKALTSSRLEHDRIVGLLEKCYEDKLEGKIPESLWQKKNQDWNTRQSQLQTAIEHHARQRDEFSYKGEKTLELVKNVYSQYVKQGVSEKREMINLVLSNPRIMNGSICYEWKNPFGFFAERVEKIKWGGRLSFSN